MTRKKPISKPSAFARAQRPPQAPDANRSNVRIDELDGQRAWQAHTCPEPRRRIAAGRIPRPKPAEGEVR